MASDFDIHIGTREGYGGSEIPFGLNDADAFQHVWLNGQTGVGKSALLLSMFAQVVRNGHGCTLIDFNGDMANEAENLIPLSRRDHVVICDPADATNVLSINPFYEIPSDRRSVAATDFTEAAKKIWIDSWGERMDWILFNVVAAILDAPPQLRPTILSIPLLLTNDGYLKAVLKHVEDINVRRFFETEFLRWPKPKRQEYIMPIENKIGKLIANPFVRNLLARYKPSFQIRHAITKRSIVIIRLSKGALGTNPASLLGALSISTLLNAALEQEAVPYEQRIPHYLFIDEMHNLTTSALTTAFSEHRKYKLAIVASTQFTDQIHTIDPAMLAAMFGNIGTIIAFRSSAADAQRFSHQIGEFPPEQYTQLGVGEVRARLLQAGKIHGPFRALTKIDVVPPADQAAQIRRYVRQRYTKPREAVEGDYQRWLRKQLIDPAEKQAQRQASADRRRTRNRARPLPPTTPPEEPTISERAVRARANIKAIVAQAHDRHAPSKKPTRRRMRRAGS
jgi:hypothetical protein